MTRSARVTALLEAAVAVVATDGLRGLTHRAVDTKAEVPPGSTSYYFRTRQALLQGIVELIAEQEQDDIDRATLSPGMGDEPMLRQAADLLAGVLAHWLGPARQRTKARLEIRLLATEQPELLHALGPLRERFLQQSRLMLLSMGSPAAEENAQLILAVVEGLTYDGVTRPNPEPPDRAALRRAVETILRAAAPH
ncbi:TetR/AcrR family transcriptional regulator [Nonomuraea sp. NPDC050556]|uniref:TetR/AcrR family transcriptional regulator n=1 Tax=Nonomuraea sp. NPDC050556 TaxID=3364369 RepID=UPI0037A75DC6